MQSTEHNYMNYGTRVFITQSQEVFKHKFTCKEINRDNKGSTASCGNATPVSESGEEKEI